MNRAVGGAHGPGAAERLRQSALKSTKCHPRPQHLSQNELQPLLASVSRSFNLSLRFLPSTVREPLGLAYLLARLSDTIADASDAPLHLRLEALETFVHALGAECADEDRCLTPILSTLHCPNPAEAALLQKGDALLHCYASLSADLQEEVRSVLKTITAGQRSDLLRFGYASLSAPQALPRSADTENYTYAVAGCVGEFWTRVCALQMPNFARTPLPELLRLGRNLGQGLQLVNILRDLPADLRAGRCYLPADQLAADGLSPADLLTNPKRARPIFERWLFQAQTWLNDGEAYVSGIRGRRLRFSVTLPRLLGLETLALLQSNPPLETPNRVKITRSTVLRCALSSLRAPE